MVKILEAQKSLANKINNIEYVNSYSCSLANRSHFDNEGTLELGRLIAKKLLQMEEEHQ